MDAPAGLRSAQDRIVAAATELLVRGGREAVSTRAVCSAAGIQPPTIYRLFGDKQGLLDAVAAHGFSTYLHSGAGVAPGPDPVEDLRRGWDLHVSFGLANPYLYSLAYGDARPGSVTPAAAAAAEILAATVHLIAQAGRLRLAEDRAVQLLVAAGCGTTLTLITMPEDLRDPTLSGLARESTIAAITTGRSSAQIDEAGPVAAAVHLRAVLDQTPALTVGERVLLQEWLDRIALS